MSEEQTYTTCKYCGRTLKAANDKKTGVCTPCYLGIAYEKILYLSDVIDRLSTDLSEQPEKASNIVNVMGAAITDTLEDKVVYMEKILKGTLNTLSSVSRNQSVMLIYLMGLWSELYSSDSNLDGANKVLSLVTNANDSETADDTSNS